MRNSRDAAFTATGLHVRLLGEQRIDPARADMEPLTDLVTVMFELGVFTANGP